MTDILLNPLHVRPLSGCTLVPKTFNSASGVVGDWVYFDNDTVLLTDADIAATVTGLVGMIITGSRHERSGALIQGERVDVAIFGRVAVGSEANLDESKQYFISNTPGKLSDTPGTVVRRVGAPESPGVFFINPASAPATS